MRQLNVQINDDKTPKLVLQTFKMGSGAFFIYSFEMVTGFLQTKMLSSSSLAAMSLVNGFLSFLMAFRSMISITDVLFAAKNGESFFYSTEYEIGSIIRKAWYTIGLVSLPMMGFSVAFPYVYSYTQLVEESIIMDVKNFLFPYSFAIPAILLLEPDISFLLTINKQIPVMKIIIVPEILKVIFSYLLIYGHLGYQPTEMSSIAYANLMATWIGCILFKIYLYHSFKQYHLFSWRNTIDENKYFKDILRLGSPFFFEVLFANGINFGLISIIGSLGKLQLSLYHVVNQWLSLYSPLIKAIIRGTKIKISECFGAQEFLLLKKYANIGHIALSGFFLLPLILFSTIPEKLAAVFLEPDDLNSLNENLPVIFLTSLSGNFLLSHTDLLIASLSGLRKTGIPALITIVTSLLTIPAAYLLTNIFNQGLFGVNTSVITTFSLNAILLGKYWSVHSRPENIIPHRQEESDDKYEVISDIPDVIPKSYSNEDKFSSLSLSFFTPQVKPRHKNILASGVEKIRSCCIIL